MSLSEEGASPYQSSPPASSRYIFNDVDMEAWKTSPLKRDLLRVVGAMGKSCANPQSKYEYDPQQPLQGLSPAMACMHGSLTHMLRWLEDDIPPLEDDPKGGGALSIRFGNPAFRTWHERLKERSLAIFREIYLVQQESSSGSLSLEEASKRGASAAALSVTSGDANTKEGDPPFLLELCSYLHDGFGHPIRLDYGTGHESSFMVVLYAACKLGWMDETVAHEQQQQQLPPSMEKLKAATISIFHAYLQVTRQLQLKYRLEPAGSHGVWGLDDYHCLPFYFGACQCQFEGGEEMPEPRDITEESIRKRHSQSLLYFGCMDYICTLKRGAPLFECSPMLYDISQTCPSWSKVASGLIKLYEGEVLNKRQVVQHFTFGKTLFVATWKPSETAPKEAPTANFRTTGVAAPMARAPWALDATTTRGGVPMEKAPWATSSGGESNSEGRSGSDMPSTRAPWAK